MTIEILSPDKKVYTGEIDLLQVPGSKSPFTVLNMHAPLISSLEKGKLRLVEAKTKKEIFFEINGGVIEVINNKILILST
ncbi:MAG TPA: F0F1 ATP synthase subunit epsilon [Bacteroidetes bacterium]|nr:F0F1 ATP synthase subunit epsilon [Bacteroidota bacterium]